MNNYWNQKGLPHRGWTCDGVEELDAATFTCEMCAKENIRFVHSMSHPEGYNIGVGCICAGHLTEQYHDMREMNRQAVSRANQKRYSKKRLEKSKAEWIQQPWVDWSTQKEMGGLKNVGDILAHWYTPDNSVWRYDYRILIDSQEVVKGRTMILAQAKAQIDQYIKNL